MRTEIKWLLASVSFSIQIALSLVIAIEIYYYVINILASCLECTLCRLRLSA